MIQLGGPEEISAGGSHLYSPLGKAATEVPSQPISHSFCFEMWSHRIMDIACVSTFPRRAIIENPILLSINPCRRFGLLTRVDAKFIYTPIRIICSLGPKCLHPTGELSNYCSVIPRLQLPSSFSSLSVRDFVDEQEISLGMSQIKRIL